MAYKPCQNIPHSCEKKLYTKRKILAIEVISLLEEKHAVARITAGQLLPELKV